MAGPLSGVPLAFSWLTVLPVRGPSDIDRTAGRRAIAAAPLTGIALGIAATFLLWGTTSIGLNPYLAGLLTVGALALGTRGMHVDGLADSVDGLGCYGPPERAREVMHSGGAGPFGVAALLIFLGLQSVSLGVLAVADSPTQWIAVLVSVAAGRVAVVFACRRGILASGPSGFGALVADSQPLWAAIVWSVPLIATSAFATDRWWLGPLVTASALVISVLCVRHCVRRFGGLNGDVLGFALELTVTLTAVGLTLGL
ncbi:adenosylcobinamide-GDP ribazoletransferase [Rhodococcus erythropolis]|uniref:adenosylcobinamide-GDP ribazoletransferase n=1 Tax=Rhodococcus TaxID=1827 RepID=UPI0012922C3A|nr:MULTISPECIES: adenosylcobinamide-GDP ribazoletransferase [Rhodococcus]MQP30841.1 adenosylcobinamide-GDP ribazoletransferase [Rhodococcus erythropolis]NRH30184.1 adenosylcobinamide-GDP ribazoletransferase [Rhodococcus sp. MS13]